jgi:hypothetical protein
VIPAGSARNVPGGGGQAGADAGRRLLDLWCTCDSAAVRVLGVGRVGLGSLIHGLAQMAWGDTVSGTRNRKVSGTRNRKTQVIHLNRIFESHRFTARPTGSG